ncbi:hypothetical protein FQN54_001936 [Arachnomyces sp. PD_36]|nr:hypothetical protein FQN54_001936 [Arachnomyces sp. PD_36]
MTPQYYKNTLQPVDLDKEALLDTLAKLQTSIRHGIELIQTECPPPDPREERGPGTVYNGSLGIAHMFLRLERQTPYITGENQPPLPNLQMLADFYNSQHQLRLGKLSPLGSESLGAPVTRMLTACSSKTTPINHRDITMLHEATQAAIDDGSTPGADEALFGRVGLLWAILNLRRCKVDDEGAKAGLNLVFENVQVLVDLLVDTGKAGAHNYARDNGHQGVLPLMWVWHDRYYLGAIHGVAGILTILLSCEPNELERDDQPSHNHLPLIAETITKLSTLCVSHNGHLPSSLPPRSTSRSSPLVQICHGTPGLLLLLAKARRNPHIVSTYWKPEWDEAIKLGTETVWNEGLLSKGGGLCHGIAGNAWPLLALHGCYFNSALEAATLGDNGSQEGSPAPLSADDFLAKALAFLLHARETPPFKSDSGPSQQPYRMPDSPYSLFEGLAGTICAWAEACVVITTRFRKLEKLERGELPRRGDIEKQDEDELGIPGLGGLGQPRGLL